MLPATCYGRTDWTRRPAALICPYVRPRRNRRCVQVRSQTMRDGRKLNISESKERTLGATCFSLHAVEEYEEIFTSKTTEFSVIQKMSASIFKL